MPLHVLFLTGVETSPLPSTDASRGSTALLDYCLVLPEDGTDGIHVDFCLIAIHHLLLYIKQMPSPEVQSKIIADVELCLRQGVTCSVQGRVSLTWLLTSTPFTYKLGGVGPVYNRPSTR